MAKVTVASLKLQVLNLTAELEAEKKKSQELEAKLTETKDQKQVLVGRTSDGAEIVMDDSNSWMQHFSEEQVRWLASRKMVKSVGRYWKIEAAPEIVSKLVKHLEKAGVRTWSCTENNVRSVKFVR